jgi:hypothetical protein
VAVDPVCEPFLELLVSTVLSHDGGHSSGEAEGDELYELRFGDVGVLDGLDDAVGV